MSCGTVDGGCEVGGRCLGRGSKVKRLSANHNLATTQRRCVENWQFVMGLGADPGRQN